MGARQLDQAEHSLAQLHLSCMHAGLSWLSAVECQAAKGNAHQHSCKGALAVLCWADVCHEGC